MATKEYATVQIENGRIIRVENGAPSATPAAAQFDGLKGYPLIFALNKLAELDYTPLQGAIDHGETQPGGANYTVIFVRDKDVDLTDNPLVPDPTVPVTIRVKQGPPSSQKG